MKRRPKCSRHSAKKQINRFGRTVQTIQVTLSISLHFKCANQSEFFILLGSELHSTTIWARGSSIFKPNVWCMSALKEICFQHRRALMHWDLEGHREHEIWSGIKHQSPNRSLINRKKILYIYASESWKKTYLSLANPDYSKWALGHLV